MNSRNTRYCSFCGRSEHEAEWLVIGPASVGICDHCNEDAAAIIAAKRRDRALAREAARCAFCLPARVGLS